jgi:hypothetical protein
MTTKPDAAVWLDLSEPTVAGLPADAVAALLAQVVDIDGPGAILASERVANGSGRVTGERVQISKENWDLICRAWVSVRKMIQEALWSEVACLVAARDKDQA